MTNEQRYLIGLLRSELCGLPTELPGRNIDWQQLYKTAAGHDLSGILYHRVKNDLKNHMPQQVLTTWENQALFRAAQQISLTENLLTTLKLLEKENIRFVLIKGLVMKQLYPYPEFRNMGDADLFVYEGCREKAIRLLRNIGYDIPEESKMDAIHIAMYRPFSCRMEIHHALWNGGCTGEVDTWYRHIWENTRFILYDSVSIPVLSVEDELINAIIHLFKHFTSSDVNLLRLFDIAVFSEKYGKKMDWAYICGTVDNFGLRRMLNALFSMYQDCFGLGYLFPGFKHKRALSKKVLEDLFRLCQVQMAGNSAVSNIDKVQRKKKTFRLYYLALFHPKAFMKKVTNESSGRLASGAAHIVRKYPIRPLTKEKNRI
jgi:hypothetical protein